MDLEQVQAKIYSDFCQVLSSGRLSHAYLFDGYFGSFELALFLAQSRFCLKLEQGLPCGDCRSCRLIQAGDFSDVHVIRPTGQVLKTELIRDALRESSQSGFESNRQVFIICDAEKMHPNASNRLLKVIEEPPADLTIFLLTSDSSKVLPTIRSRCQLVSFMKNETYLMELLLGQGLLKNQAEAVSHLAKTIDEAMSMAKNTRLLDQIRGWENFVDKLMTQPEQAFLESARLANLCLEKTEQEQGLALLTVLLAKRKKEKQARDYLTKLHVAYGMWRSHVSFQSALEYMIIS
ncbi:DNA polymerase III subunit delta' [Streptococcus cuniculipharyngis]|uniref:DNA polymerase III subunit delta n=1 Tax=Streptococcus cuniculipharyngis TaxID=1562651 RepID=A0A5C5S8S0_9STRE|nr:DNA polymerase III subunit delta' [Streptococcus cuniculipharyngis]TWS96708.1 DNA polymerase III subunit delta' [Streptococcus cuniculipharyngis]